MQNKTTYIVPSCGAFCDGMKLQDLFEKIGWPGNTRRNWWGISIYRSAGPMPTRPIGQMVNAVTELHMANSVLCTRKQIDDEYIASI